MVRKPSSHRYFLGFRPDRNALSFIWQITAALGLDPVTIDAVRLHLTLFVVAETEEQRTDLAPLVDAIFRQARLASCRIKLGKAKRGQKGAFIASVGNQREIQTFYRQLIVLLAPLGIEPLHRKSGLSPHITLDYRKDGPERNALIPFEWVPSELLLIESLVGQGVHNVIARWPLLPPCQGELDLCARC